MARIEAAEIDGRRAACAKRLERAGVDCLLVLPGSNFTYLTGLSFARERHRLLLALITRDGDLTLMGTVFEVDKMALGRPARIVTWTDEEDQYRRVADIVTGFFGGDPVIALEPTTNYYHYLALRERVPRAVLVDPVPFTDALRAIKSPAEIACVREACARTRGRMERVPAQLEAGMTELEMARRFGSGAMIQFGPTTASPNEGAGDRRLAARDLVVIDAGDRVEGYRSDLTRTFFFGEPTRRMVEVFAVVEAAKAAAVEAARPGAPAEIVDLAARRVIERAGFGGFFTHRGGHGIGLDFHEIPICVAGNTAPLEPGMILTAEPGIYLPGEFGVRLEDDLLITADGCEVI